MRHSIILCLTMYVTGFGAWAADSNMVRRPNTGVDAIFAAYGHAAVPGCALGVIRNGGFIYRRGYGSANLEYGIPISSASIFQIGSTSKQFTAMAIALLAETGQISLEDTLRRYFPEFPAWSEGITVNHLLHHTSGIRDYPTLAQLAGKGDDADFYTDQWVIDMLARQRETNFPPGSQYLYSNSGYLLLAHLVKRASGQSLREYSQEHIFAPLGMTHTHFHDDHTEIVPNRASGYAPGDEGYRISMTNLDLVGDGGVFTSIDDLLLWDSNFYDNRLGTNGPALIEQITTPGQLADGTSTDYAFGLNVEQYRGLKLISHGGSFVGYRAELIRFPDESFSVAVLCNRADTEPPMLARRVADVFLADELDAEPQPQAPGQPITLNAEQLERYAGDFWEDREGFAAQARVIDGKLWAVHSPTRRNELVPAGPDRFEMIGLPAKVFVQYTMDKSRIIELHRTINGKPRGRFTPFTRRQATAEELAQYTGDYYSPELDIHYFLEMSGATLTFRLDDDGPQELTAMFEETFENPDYGSFRFRRNADGRVTGFLLQSGRERNLVFERK